MSLHRFAKLAIFLTLFSLISLQGAFAGKSDLSFKQIIIAEDPLLIKTTQLVEVHIRNKNAKDRKVLVRLKITLPNHNIVTYGKKRVLLKGNTDTPVLFPYYVNAKGTGNYTIAAKIYDERGNLLLTSKKRLDRYFYALNPKTRSKAPDRRRGQTLQQKKNAQGQPIKERTAQAAAVVSFDPPDLTWGKIDLLNASVLRGENTHVRVRLQNEGGDLAKNVEINLLWYFTQRPKRKVSFHRQMIRHIAPGEEKIIEIPLTVPPREPSGKYSVAVMVDPGDSIAEGDEGNNSRRSKVELIFGDVALEFPENEHSFAEDGLIKFAWRSKQYDEYKIQISADPTFNNPEALFEIPKGPESWSRKNSIKPMKGEMPTLALALMDANETDHLFWRVIARNSKGKTTRSQSRKFFINLIPFQP